MKKKKFKLLLTFFYKHFVTVSLVHTKTFLPLMAVVTFELAVRYSAELSSSAKPSTPNNHVFMVYGMQLL